MTEQISVTHDPIVEKAVSSEAFPAGMFYCDCSENPLNSRSDRSDNAERCVYLMLASDDSANQGESNSSTAR